VSVEIRSKSILLDPIKQQVHLLTPERRTLLSLTPIEFKLLHLFLRNQDHVFTRMELKKELWGEDVHISIRTIDTHVKNLRNKLGQEGKRISSVHSVGFSFSKI